MWLKKWSIRSCFVKFQQIKRCENESSVDEGCSWHGPGERAWGAREVEDYCSTASHTLQVSWCLKGRNARQLPNLNLHHKSFKRVDSFSSEVLQCSHSLFILFVCLFVLSAQASSGRESAATLTNQQSPSGSDTHVGQRSPRRPLSMGPLLRCVTKHYVNSFWAPQVTLLFHPSYHDIWRWNLVLKFARQILISPQWTTATCHI